MAGGKEKTKPGGTRLQSQHLGGGGRRRGQLCYMRPCPPKEHMGRFCRLYINLMPFDYETNLPYITKD